MKICKMEQNYPKVQNQTFGMNLKVRTIDEETVDGVLSAINLRTELRENPAINFVYTRLEQGLAKIEDDSTIFAVDGDSLDEFRLAYPTSVGDSLLPPTFSSATGDNSIELALKMLPSVVQRFKRMFS